MDSKARIRSRVWSQLERQKVARFPGARGRVPNFVGAERAAQRLAELEVWRQAKVIKCNPDSPQQPVRKRALEEGKIVYMAVPRLRELKCFIELDPAKLVGKFSQAATIRGGFALGKPVSPNEMQQVDLVVAGSVAVNHRGARIGKGGGYSDLEFALARQFGLIHEKTPVVTTVHPLQVLEEELPVTSHDIPVDFIVTPDEVIATRHCFPKPEKIEWSILTTEMLESIPILQFLNRRFNAITR